MKRLLFVCLLLAAPAFMLAQVAPPPPAVLPIPDPIVALLVTVFASGASWYKIIDGLKNMIPWLKDNPTAIKWLSIVGNFLTVGGGCIVMGHVNDAFDVLKCLVGAVLASLMSAGLYEGKKQSDLARAGGAANLVNAKAVAEVSSAPSSTPVPPVEFEGSKKGK